VRVVVESLAEEFDIMDIATAAVKLAHAADGGDDEEEIRDVALRSPAEARSRSGPGTRPGKPPRGERPGRGERGDTARIFIGAGRAAGIRPQDLVGAIANEAGISGREIGSIEISERFSLVELNVAVIADVIEALRGSTLKGRKITVRRER
jgi:ATP-dependent RNA helicase DeaD